MASYNETKTLNSESDRFKLMRNITQILLPLSVFSILCSHPSLAPLFLQSYDYLVANFSNFSFKFKLFTYTSERNCIFLLCNGILVLIIQSSGLISKITPVKSGPKTARADFHHRAERDDENARFEESNKNGAGKVEILEEKVSENGGEVEEDFQSSEVEKWDDVEEEEEEEEEEEDDDDDDGGIDTEELKKKCEDFIKKVKMEIHGA